MRVRGSDGFLFAKIYSTNHLRSDRWYRFGRTLLYGQLEDEVPFGSVRRLVEYEDYALRLLDDVGIRVARTYGVVELIPNREYMIVTEFFEGAATLGEAEVDDVVIDEGLELVRTMWDRGLAHRDIKPANLLVRQGHLQLVDVSGLEIRPSGWRQLVDLANMMLVLALQSDPDRVFGRATRLFTVDEIAEAFAADVGLAVPTQLQARLEADQRPIRERFQEIVPAHAPISIQRWSVRRTALLIGSVLGALVLAAMFVDALTAGLR
jgi:tRNA A-37 threonylcarbamoyl transferase component Bud32